MRTNSASSPARWRSLRWLVPIGAVAVVMPFAPTATAVVGGTATADASDVALSSTTPVIELNGGTNELVAPATVGEDRLEVPLDVSASGSSVESSITSAYVNRAANVLQAQASVDELTVTLLGQEVVAAGIVAEVYCPLDAAPFASAEANVVIDGTLSHLIDDQQATGSVVIEDVDGAGTNVTVAVDASASATTTDGGAGAVGLQITISLLVQPATGPTSDVALGSITLAEVGCEQPTGPDEGGVETPGPGGGATSVPDPGDGLAETGSSSMVVTALAAAMFVTGGASALLWGRRRTRG